MTTDSPPTWKVLIVDDERDVITTTRHTLMDVTVLGRPLEFIAAASAADAEGMLVEHPDIAVVLLDVVMEKMQSGLTLVNRIRTELNNHGIRIILRTGKAGEAPERDVVHDYAIDDYIDKGSVTRNRLITAVVTAIRAFEQYRRVERMSARFELLVASIGHDLRSPLQVIQSSLALIERSTSTAQRVQRIQTAQFAAKTVGRLVDDILSIARGQSLSFGSQPVDIKQWFEQFMSTFSAKIASKNLVLHTHFDVTPAYVAIDPDRLSQCVGNLLDNAIRYTDAGQIEVSIELDGPADELALHELRVIVADTGRGIALADHARIFEPFERVTTHNSPPGTGLGLSIVSNLAQGLGGTISIASEPAVGSTFTLKLPVHLSKPPEAPAPIVKRPVGHVTGATKSNNPEILVLDDDLDICRNVVDVLREAGFATDSAHSAEEALRMLEHAPYKVVLTDIQMPGLDGFEFAHLLRLADNPPHLIAMTAYVEGFQTDPRSKYFQGKLKKPFNEDSLLTLISAALE